MKIISSIAFYKSRNFIPIRMNKPTISIIVPCYNVEEFLNETIECILNQTYQDWELLLVDDGSRDLTPRICDDYAKKDSRIKVIHKQNGGLVSARNTGYDAATGDWHMYLDGDDWIDMDTCEKLISYLSRHTDVDIVFGNVFKSWVIFPSKENGSGYVQNKSIFTLRMNVMI